MASARANRKSAMLVICAGGFEGTRYELQDGKVLIGRNPNTDITLLDEGISREHALIVFEPDGGQGSEYMIQDLRSTNGTWVNGQEINSAPLRPGDRIQIGMTVFQFAIE